VPPDTIKNVAATSGQSVSFAALFFAVGIAREGSWVGTDIELNFYSRLPKRISLSPLPWPLCGHPENEASSHSQNTRVAPACKKKMGLGESFSQPRQTYFCAAPSPGV
jgi:hypothetical protein